MSRIIQSPTKYVQGYDEIKKLSAHTKLYGNKPYVIMDSFLYDKYHSTISEDFDGHSMPYYFEVFQGECTEEEVNRHLEKMLSFGSDVIIAIGGGKTIDVGKAISYFSNLPILVVPTVASTDAPCSALSVLYHKSGQLDRYLTLRHSPNLVLVDTHIILEAPTRLLVAGMGDALSTYFEAAACYESYHKNASQRQVSLAALALARQCLHTILQDGIDAKVSCDDKKLSPAFENIVEANIYLSGIGFESGGLAAAHAIHNGFTLLPESAATLHGEKIAFTTIVQLILQKYPQEEIQKIILFCKAVGLPTCLKDLKMEHLAKDALFTVAKASTSENSVIHNMPFKVTADDVLSAILTADKLGATL